MNHRATVASIGTMTTRFLLLGQRHCVSACDRLIRWGIFFLIFFTPSAFGAVHPWAFSVMEVVAFLLVLTCIGRILLSSHPVALLPLPPPLLPLTLFLGLVCFLLLPLPPSLLSLLSPSTYDLYSRSLPGWPLRPPYGELVSLASETSKISGDTPSVMVNDQKFLGSPAPCSRLLAPGSLLQAPCSELPAPSSLLPACLSHWRSLSLAPALTLTSLLKWCAYSCVLFVVLLYPFNHKGEGGVQFSRSVLRAVLFTGFCLAAIGIIQQWTWNGKFLWFFVPYDWNGPGSLVQPRASGPFINPDHFANYLAVIFPLALVGTFFRTDLVSQRLDWPLRIFCGCSVFLLITGILLSLSRSGWLGMALGLLLVLVVFPYLRQHPHTSASHGLKYSVTKRVAVSVVVLVISALLFVGPTSRNMIDTRLAETVEKDDSLQGRVSAWQDTMNMVRDFPLFGVGLGAWQDVFPRYERPPWSADYFSEAHNDYVEILAETGFTGFGILAWAVWRIAKRLARGLTQVSVEIFPLYTALLAGLVVMGFHELVDFNLQIPANAVLCTVLLGTALRLTLPELTNEHEHSKPARQSPVRTSLVVLGAVLTVGFLLMLALGQERMPYPNSLVEPLSFAAARERVLSHPARGDSHFELYRLLRRSDAPPEALLKELDIALWLDPRDPYARDRYAQNLQRQGKLEESLQEITRSVFVAPSLADHHYLNSERIEQLSVQQRAAVEEGFKRAVAANYIAAVPGLSSMYAAFGRFADEAKLYEDAAHKEADTTTQLQYLLSAGVAYLRAKKSDEADTVLRRAIAIAPSEIKAYQYLATQILAPQGKLGQAKILVEEGINNGADSFALTLVLADVAQIAKNSEEMKAALLQAIALQPSSFDTQLRLALLYLQERSFDRAALVLRKALDVKPESASAFYHLGEAEEGRYQLFAAEKAYARAVELAPDNNGFRQRYEAFQKATREEQGARS